MKSILIQKMLDMSGSKELEDNFLEVPGFLTGFNGFDFYSSTLKTGVNGFPLINGGLFPRLTNVIGGSATGKTTLTVQLISSAIDRIQRRFGEGYSEFFFHDLEQNSSPTRIMSLTGWTNSELLEKCSFNQKSLSLVEFANFLIKIVETKKKYKKDLLLPSGIKDVSGKEVMFLAPTFILIDSIAAVNPNGIETLVSYNKLGEIKNLEKLGTNMDGATDAKAWTIFIRKMKPFLDEGNVNLILINHKVPGIQTDMYSIPEKVLPFLKPGEKLKGGSEIIYQSYMILDLMSKEKYNQLKNPIYGEDVDGFSVKATFVKNKNNIEGVSFPLVFDKSKGFLPELGDFEYLFQEKWGFSGSPMSMHLDILPEVKFTRKNLYDHCQEYPLLARALSFTTKIGMGSKMLFQQYPPDLNTIGSTRTLEDRVALITSFTDSYPGYIDRHIDLSSEIKKMSVNNRKYIMSNIDFNFIDSIPTYEDMELLIKDEKVGAFVPFTDQIYTPYDEFESIDEYKFALFKD